MSSRIVPFEQMEDSTDTQRAYSTQMSGASTATAGTSTEFSDPSFATENDLNFADQIQPTKEKSADDVVTKTELRAWYGYDVANSPYSQVVISVFAPLLMELMADVHSNDGAAELTCDQQDTETKVYPCRACVEGRGDRLFTNANTHTELSRRRVMVFGTMPLDPISYASLAISISVIFQALSYVTFGALADFGSNRLVMLRRIAVLGALSTMAFALIPAGKDNHRYWEVAGLLTIVSNVLFGLSIVYYNAFLPLIANMHPDHVAMKDEAVQDFKFVVHKRVQNEVSSKGFIYGYGGGVVMLLVSGLILLASGALASDAKPHVIVNGYKYVCLVTGIWWLVGTLACTAYMHPRPGPPLPFKTPEEDADVLERARYYWRVASVGWASTFRTFQNITQLPQTFIFLIIYFIYSDTFSTIASVGILYARTQLCLGPLHLFIIATLVPFIALFGSMFWLKISNLYNFSNQRMVIMILTTSALAPAWGLLSFTSTGLGFQQSWEVYILTVLFGMCLGGLQSFSRTLFSNLMPKGYETEFFGIYEITDKGSSWLGPLIVAAFYEGTGSLRHAFIYLFLGTTVPALLLHFFITEDKGIMMAQTYALNHGRTRFGGVTQHPFHW